LNESFLHYIWQHQYFNRNDLKTLDGELVTVFHPGNYNRNAGPDFLESKIKIDSVEWAGSVEIHIKSSDFNAHQHQSDTAYNNVVLHVVWQHDKEVKRKDGTVLPTLELRGRVDEALVKEYRRLVNSSFQIPCSPSISRVKSLTVVSMIEQATIQRLNAKAEAVQKIYQLSKGDWEETFYQVLAKNFGFKVNADAFLNLSRALSLKTLRKSVNDLHKTEALLFGMAGFLDQKKGDEYYLTLKKEFDFQSHKFSLAEFKMNKAQWKFLRLRPANFPTLRLAQLSGILSNSTPLIEKIIATADLKQTRKLFSYPPSGYWHSHYSFGKESKKFHGNLGDESLDNILINSVVPTLAAYATEKGEEVYFNRALEFLQQLKPESNSITRAWQVLNIKASNAFDSQGLIEQMNSFCKKRNCLNCSVGASLLRPS
jgi:hypothetical protein